MDPSQSELLTKLPISIEQDSLRCDTCVIIDSSATLSFASQKSLRRIGLVGRCICCPKIFVHNFCGQRDPQCFLLATFSLTILSYSQETFLVLRFYVLPQLKCVGFFFWVASNERVECVYSTFGQLNVDWYPSFVPCESQPRRVSCVLAYSFIIQLF